MATQTVQGKRVMFRLLNDKFDRGRAVTINSKATPTLDSLYDELTASLLNHKGGTCIRSVCTPGGTPITEFEQFQPGHEYHAIAGSNNTAFRRFKPRYTEIPPPKPPILLNKGRYQKIDLNRPVVPVVHAKTYQAVQSRAMSEGDQCQSIVLKVHRYEEYAKPVHKVCLKRKDMANMPKIIKTIAECIGGDENLRIYQHNRDATEHRERYREILIPEDVESIAGGGYCVAASRTEARKISTSQRPGSSNPYTEKGKENFQIRIVSPGRFPEIPNDRKRHNRSFGNKRVLGSIGSNSKKSSQAASPYSNPPSQDRRKQFSHRSRQTREVDYDDDRGGVFKAKGQDHTKGAQQVNETRDTRTERPIDQVEAEEVDEEEFPSKEKTTPIPPGTELNKKPSKEQKQDKDAKKQKQSEDRLDEDKGQK